MGNWVVDFYCPSEKLVVELDGAHHFTEEGKERDKERDAILRRELGLTVLRIPNHRIWKEMEAVLELISAHFSSPTSPCPLLDKEGIKGEVGEDHYSP